MKRLLLSTFAASLLFASCGNDAKVKSVTKNEDGTTTTTSYDAESIQKMADAGDEMTKKTEELKKLTPLTLEQLKSLLPEELNGIKRTNYNTQNAMGYAVAEGDYNAEDNKGLKVVIYDCAGEAGASMYSLTYWGAMNFQQESEKEYTKTIEFNGGKAIENYRKDDNITTLTYVANDRMVVVLTGNKMDPGSVKDAAQKLELKL
jgi:hypothetical protein